MDTQSSLPTDVLYRLQRVALLGTDPRCCDEDHDWEYNYSAETELLTWILGGDRGAFWICRINGDSANGYEYTCSDCTRRHEQRALRELRERCDGYREGWDFYDDYGSAPWPELAPPQVGQTFIVGWHNPTDGWSVPVLHPPF